MYGNYAHPQQVKDVFKSIEDEDVENIRFYITDGADPDMENEHGHSLLVHAMIHKKYHAAETLLEMGADPDHLVRVTGQSALHYAAADDSAHMIGVLKAHKADADLQDIFRWTPLHMAASRGKPEAAKALVEAGADMTLRNGDNERPVDTAAKRLRDTLQEVRDRATLVMDYLNGQMRDSGVEFMTKDQREQELAKDIAALKSRNPNRFKLAP